MTSPGRALVTGANGFIGRRLVAALARRGNEIVGWTRAMGDLRDGSAVARALTDLRPTTIYHLAAGNAALTEADWTVPADEVRMLANLAEAMPDGARLIHTGSVAEYGRSGTLDERDPCRPRSVYGFAKAAASDHALALVATRGLDIRVARLFGVFGPGEADRRLVPHLVSHLSAGRPVPLGDGGQVRDFIHVDDVCDRLIALADITSPPVRLLNIGTGVGVTVRQACETVAALLGADPALLRFGALPRRPIDEDVLIARTDRLAALGPVPAQHWFTDDGKVADYVGALRDTCTDGASHNDLPNPA